jgi:nicotinamidase-related amidase
MAEPVVVVDMINAYDHEDGERCAEHAVEVVPRIVRLLADARAAGDPVVYVNDHYGSWSGDRELLARMVLEDGRHPELVEPLLPERDDLFLFKGRHSIFYETPLAFLLGRELQTERVTLVGQVTEQCILYSALDAYVREFDVCVVRDCTVAIDDRLADAALEMMRRNMHAELIDAGDYRTRSKEPARAG